jgi:hypothetical protein
MPSMSQIDMVVWLEGTKELQVCGNLEPRERAPEAAEILVVVRQDGNVARLHETRTYGSWELKVELGPERGFTIGRAVASAVVILKQEPAGLETISWVQPVTIMDKWEAPDPSKQVNFLTEAVNPPTKGTLTADHSISSSISIVQDDATGGTYRWQQQIERTPLAIHPTS